MLKLLYRFTIQPEPPDRAKTPQSEAETPSVSQSELEREKREYVLSQQSRRRARQVFTHPTTFTSQGVALGLSLAGISRRGLLPLLLNHITTLSRGLPHSLKPSSYWLSGSFEGPFPSSNVLRS